MSARAALLGSYILALWLMAGGMGACAAPPSDRLFIATAANMQFAMEELTRAFTEQSGIECETIIGSSGKLTAQIQEGAPFDVLVSADMKYPEELLKNGFVTAPPVVYAYGRLVLWTVAEDLTPRMDVLTDPSVRHIALANPTTAPYGLAAWQVLLEMDLLDRVERKLVYGESIAQTNQFITSAAAELGFTALAVVRSPAMRDVGRWIVIDPAWYDPIAQGAIVLNNRPEAVDRARRFCDFLQSERARAILLDYGYDVP